MPRTNTSPSVSISEEDAKAKLADGKHAIVEGDPASKRDGPPHHRGKAGMRMPPRLHRHDCLAQEIETLRTWIAQGAKWEKHWSFIASERPAAAGK